MLRGGPGGRGGGGAFPYRSAHQQGTDGRGGGRGRGRGRGRGGGRRNTRGGRGGGSSCTAEIHVPSDHRGLLVGKGGSTLRYIRECTGAHVEVPGDRGRGGRGGRRGRGRGRGNGGQEVNSQEGGRGENGDSSTPPPSDVDRRPVRVKSDRMSSLLHACWEVAHIAIKNNASSRDDGNNNSQILDEGLRVIVRIPGSTSATTTIKGTLQRKSIGECFMASGNESADQKFSVYCLEHCGFMDEDDMAILVDNERFANPEVTAFCDFVSPSVEENENDNNENNNCGGKDQKKGLTAPDGRQQTSLLFVYGTEEQKPHQLYQALERETFQLWKQFCDKNYETISPITKQSDLSLPENPFTVGTYNLLHPRYAEKYNDGSGVDRGGKSNWKIRSTAIKSILKQCHLDVYFLQEVDALRMKNDILNDGNQLCDQYECIHYVHPTREAQDGVAILLKKDRFELIQSEMVPYEAKLPEHAGLKYMCAATAIVKDRLTSCHFLLACVHFYEKKCLHPQQALLEYIYTHSQKEKYDGIIWGGDCNKEYKSILPGEKGEFASPSSSMQRNEEGKWLYPTRGHKKIDWIFYSPPTNFSSVTSESSGGFVKSTKLVLEATGYAPSDHFGEATTFCFCNEKDT